MMQIITGSQLDDLAGAEGARIPAGDIACNIYYGAAKQDPKEFPNPDEFRLDRDLRKPRRLGHGYRLLPGPAGSRRSQSYPQSVHGTIFFNQTRYDARRPGVGESDCVWLPAIAARLGKDGSEVAPNHLQIVPQAAPISVVTYQA